ncbi:MAG: TAXI family TRAP transporter solute-binding subunit [Pseudolabrys sp.]
MRNIGKIGWRRGVIVGVVALGAGAALAAPLKITLAGGSVGGAWSTMGTAIGETIRLSSPGSSFTYEPGVDAANVQLVSTGRVQLGIAHAQMALRGLKGEEPFKATTPDIKAIALLDPQAAVQILVRADSKISSLADIKNNKMPVRVAFNKRGTMMAVAGEEVFKAAGIAVDDIAKWGGRIDYVDYNTGLAQLKDGKTDLVLNMLAFPSAQVKNMARDVDMRLIGLDRAVIDKLSKDVGTKPVTVPAETYPFAKQAVETVTGMVVLVASDKMSEEEAATIAKGLVDHYSYLEKAYPPFSRMGAKALPDVAPLTLHPGAAKAYKAAGLLK